MRARITDHLPLAAVALEYQLNGGGWQSESMARSAGTDEWTARFPLTVAPGYSLRYRIVATDGAAVPQQSKHPAFGDHALEVIEPVGAAVIDLDGNRNSAPVILDDLNRTGVSAEHFTGWPAVFDHFRSLWICLGVAPDNHTLGFRETIPLNSFIEAGGSVYLEGGDCWANDHVWRFVKEFGIGTSEPGGADAALIRGEEGSIEEGLAYE